VSRYETFRIFFRALEGILSMDFSTLGETWADWYCLCFISDRRVVVLDGLDSLERFPWRERALLWLEPLWLRKRRLEVSLSLGWPYLPVINLIISVL
jgi:hypothetical protein